jgi:hypothetical protein
MPISGKAVMTRSLWSALCAALFAIIAAAHASDAHATWKTGRGGPPTWDEWICPDSGKVQFATFSYTSEPPETMFTIEFLRGAVMPGQPHEVLAAGQLALEQKTLFLNPLLGHLPSLNWRRGREGELDYTSTFRTAFQSPVRAGAQVTMRFHLGFGESDSWVYSTYTVRDCTGDWIVPPW